MYLQCKCNDDPQSHHLLSFLNNFFLVAHLISPAHKNPHIAGYYYISYHFVLVFYHHTLLWMTQEHDFDVYLDMSYVLHRPILYRTIKGRVCSRCASIPPPPIISNSSICPTSSKLPKPHPI